MLYAGVDSFLSAEENGFDLNNYKICQLPHHGSRRSINSTWIAKFNPDQFWVSADGSTTHPKKSL